MSEAPEETRIIEDWEYWFERKAKTLDSANSQAWRKKLIKHRLAQNKAQQVYLQRWIRSKYNLLNEKNR